MGYVYPFSVPFGTPVTKVGLYRFEMNIKRDTGCVHHSHIMTIVLESELELLKKGSSKVYELGVA